MPRFALVLAPLSLCLALGCTRDVGNDAGDGASTGDTVDPTDTTSATDAPTSTSETTSNSSDTTDTDTDPETETTDDPTDGPRFDVGTLPDTPPGEPLPLPQLWYSIEDKLVYIELDPSDGSVAQLVVSTFSNDPPLLSSDPNITEYSSLTMLADGSLLGARGTSGTTQFYHVAEPPTLAGQVEANVLGVMPDNIYVEALHTDCDGRVYVMDTGVDSANSIGNRLLRLTGDYLAGDFSYEVITDLMVASADDIDDMGPGIDELGEVTDNPGFAIDSGIVYAFDYATGTGMPLGMAGTYGIHVLGGPLFDDGISRLYVFDIDAQLFEADPETLMLSDVLVTGPDLPNPNGVPGLCGMAGPLTDCISGFPQG